MVVIGGTVPVSGKVGPGGILDACPVDFEIQLGYKARLDASGAESSWASHAGQHPVAPAMAWRKVPQASRSQAWCWIDRLVRLVAQGGATNQTV